jgi:hypothetical protein
MNRVYVHRRPLRNRTTQIEAPVDSIVSVCLQFATSSLSDDRERQMSVRAFPYAADKHPRPRTEVERAAFAAEVRAACQGAVRRVLEELPARDRQVLEDRRAEVEEATHRETLAALDEVVGMVGGLARG